MKKLKKGGKVQNKQRTVLIGLLIVLVAGGLFWKLRGMDKIRGVYYGYKVSRSFGVENRKLGEPLKAMGFQQIKGGGATCTDTERAGYDKASLYCEVNLQSYRQFGDEKSKNQ